LTPGFLQDFFIDFVILLASLFCLLKRRYLIGINPLYTIASLVTDARHQNFFMNPPWFCCSIFICAWLPFR
jgi:hypothetical protein